MWPRWRKWVWEDVWSRNTVSLWVFQYSSVPQVLWQERMAVDNSKRTKRLNGGKREREVEDGWRGLGMDSHIWVTLRWCDSVYRIYFTLLYSWKRQLHNLPDKTCVSSDQVNVVQTLWRQWQTVTCHHVTITFFLYKKKKRKKLNKNTSTWLFFFCGGHFAACFSLNSLRDAERHRITNAA